MQTPLSDLRVIDMATLLAGPGAARHLADMGAEVIKVEPPTGDPARRLGWVDPRDGQTFMWKLVGRNKRSVVYDLKTRDGLASMQALLDTADVLVENMRPGTLERLGLAPTELLASNPRLVVLRMTGFGQSGPNSSRPGFATLAEAMSGFAAINGEPDGKPLLPPVALTDEVAAIAGAFAVMVALHERTRSGLGQVVDVSLLETMFHLLGPLPAAAAHLSYEQPRLGGGIPYSVPRNTYRCADDRWVAISTSSDTIAARVLDLLGVGDEPRFSTFAGRETHRVELDELVATWVAQRSSTEVIAAFDSAHAAIAPVLGVSEVLAHPHVVARDAFPEIDGVRMVAPIARLSRTPGMIEHGGRPLGVDTDAVQRELDEGV